MKKKLMVIFMMLVLAVSMLAGCGSKGEEKNTVTGTFMEKKDFMFTVQDEKGHYFGFNFDIKPENYEKIKELSHLLDTHPVCANGSSHYEQIISGKELKYRDKEGGITLEFKPEGCTFTISDKRKSFSCVLGHNEFKHEPTDFDQYFMPISSAQDYAYPRPIGLKPETYGSYTWIGVSHLRIMVMFKDHTCYNYWDIYFDDKRARVDETFTYLVEGYDYHTKNVLVMV